MPQKEYDEQGNEIGETNIVRNFILNEPEIRVVDINPITDDFFFLATDGLFDRYNSKECIKLFRKKLTKNEILE